MPVPSPDDGSASNRPVSLKKNLIKPVQVLLWSIQPTPSLMGYGMQIIVICFWWCKRSNANPVRLLWCKLDFALLKIRSHGYYRRQTLLWSEKGEDFVWMFFFIPWMIIITYKNLHAIRLFYFFVVFLLNIFPPMVKCEKNYLETLDNVGKAFKHVIQWCMNYCLLRHCMPKWSCWIR